MINSILILGGNGFIGKNIIENLLEKDKLIILLNRKEDILDNKYRLNPQIKVIEGELSCFELIKDAIEKYNVDIIIHLASSLIPSSSIDEFHYEMVSVIQPTYKIIDYISNKDIKFVFFSSGGTIYGNSKEKLNETHPTEPINLYGYSKLLVEQYILLKFRQEGLNYLIIRPSNVFGKFQRLDGKQGFIATAIKKIQSYETIEIWGNGKNIRDYFYVSDLVYALDSLLEKSVSNEIINIGSGTGYNQLQIINIIECLLDKSAKIIFREKRPFDLEYMVLSIDKLKSFINYTPLKIEEGIRKFIEYFKNYEK